MNKTQAQELGRQAFENGLGNFPFAIPEIMAEMQNAKVGEKTHILKPLTWAGPLPTSTLR